VAGNRNVYALNLAFVHFEAKPGIAGATVGYFFGSAVGCNLQTFEFFQLFQGFADSLTIGWGFPDSVIAGIRINPILLLGQFRA
jgi:hypothetical protein